MPGSSWLMPWRATFTNPRRTGQGSGTRATGRAAASSVSAHAACEEPTMNFETTEEQQQLADWVSKYLAAHYSFEQRKSIVHSATGFSDAVWATLV